MSDDEEKTKKPAQPRPAEPKNEIDRLTILLESDQAQFYQEAQENKLWIINSKDKYWYNSTCRAIKTLLQMSTKGLNIFNVQVNDHFRNLKNLMSGCILFPTLYGQVASEIMHARLPLLPIAQRQMFQNMKMSAQTKAEMEDCEYFGRCLTNDDKLQAMRILNFHDETFLPSELLLCLAGIALCRTKNPGVEEALRKVIFKHPRKMRKRLIMMEEENNDSEDENYDIESFLNDKAIETSEIESD